MVDKGHLYLQVYNDIRKQIENNTFREGDLLPSENEMCQEYGITRPTIRHALDLLTNEGFIQKRKGKGSIVCQIPTGIGILSIGGTTSALGNFNLETRILVKPVLTKWPADFLFPLSDFELGNSCIYMERLRLVDKKPIFFERTYIPNIHVPRFVNKNLENKSLLETLKKSYHIEVKGGEQHFKAVAAEKTIAGFLQISEGLPILFFNRKHITNIQGFRFYSTLYCNTMEHSLFGTF